MNMPSVMTHSFSRAPQLDIQRSNFDRSHGHKTTFDAGWLIPVFVDDALPGDTFNMNCSCFARLATPLHPIMDNMYMDVHFFSVPYRLVWSNFRKFMGEQAVPGDSIDYAIPKLSALGGPVVEMSIHDYFGLPLGFDTANLVSCLPFRAYCLIYNEWYRDQNLLNSLVISLGDGPDAQSSFTLQRRGKRHDYFTSCLPWPQKGSTAVSIPLGTTAPVTVNSALTTSGALTETMPWQVNSAGGGVQAAVAGTPPAGTPFVTITGIADLSTATAATINQLRQAVQVQKLLEIDARGGTRYAEIVKAHFGVTFVDASYRPEYLGGTSVPINIHPVPQTSETNTTPQGNLAAFGTVGLSGGGFTKSFTEHCIVIAIASVRADLTYQQGIEKMWLRSTRYDFYWPSLANIGEQPVLSREIYWDGSAGDADVFGYQEKDAAYRYKPSRISGLFRSNASAPLDSWHLAQEFSSRPTLNSTFIRETPPVDRVIEVPAEPHFIADFYFKLNCARPMPVYSIPGMGGSF